MKSVYLYVAVATTIATLAGGIILSSQGRSRASVEKVAQYKQNSLNQNPTQNVPNTPKFDIYKGMKMILVMAMATKLRLLLEINKG